MIDYYEQRHTLFPEQVYETLDGSVVKLDRRVPGDGTKWYVADWSEGYSSEIWGDVPSGWSYYDGTIEPGDLALRLIEWEV